MARSPAAWIYNILQLGLLCLRSNAETLGLQRGGAGASRLSGIAEHKLFSADETRGLMRREPNAEYAQTQPEEASRERFVEIDKLDNGSRDELAVRPLRYTMTIATDIAEPVPMMEKLLVEPSKEKPVAFLKNTSFSQCAQDKWVDDALGGRNGLFLVESGAYDGEHFSNSLFFEVNRESQALLVEPDPKLQEKILALNRNSYLFPGGLSSQGNASWFQFNPDDVYGRLLGKESPDAKEKNHRAVHVACYPLQDILSKLGRNVVDYWSLDVEGAEVGILKTIDFTKTTFGLISVETNGHGDEITTLLESKGFKKASHLGFDVMYMNTQYFADRKLPTPPYKEDGGRGEKFGQNKRAKV